MHAVHSSRIPFVPRAGPTRLSLSGRTLFALTGPTLLALTGPTLLALTGLTLLAWAAPGLSAQEAPAEGTNYERASAGTRWLVAGSGLSIKMLVEASNLGADEVEIGEITFPVGSGATGGGHAHGRVEIFYILEGTFDHVVNGEAHRLTPGMVGIVRPGDEVIHRVVGDAPVRALVIWAPGGEADRIARGLEVRPIDDPPPF